MNGDPSISREGSVSSRGSVRITITNMAEANGNIQDLDSPGLQFYLSYLFNVLLSLPTLYMLYLRAHKLVIYNFYSGDVVLSRVSILVYYSIWT